ncbi:MAG TPA: patatin-like phospholipase family protein [Flavilitoribacter sp.]|nr:patatin-like phospholipase family protein [Flavilitoribacter sp.]HMQ88663.1 patatin-like phospholipase family protein [Flavilitoribacter sp.]
MKGLVISGGGSKGAFAGGIAEHLIRDCGTDYGVLVGTSTGSLLVPLLALGEVERLKKVYTAVRQSDVFNINPFIIRKKENGQYLTKINHFNTLRMFLKGRKTFGESRHLRRMIRESYFPEDHQRLKDSGKKVAVTVSNFTLNRVEYKMADECSYEDFCDWMWLSCNLVPFMSLAEKDKFEYGDGGFGALIPIQQSINMGAKEIDVIILQAKQKIILTPPSRNAFMLLLKALDFMMNQIGQDDVTIGNLACQVHDVSIFTYYTPRVLTDNSFIFDPEQMFGWWEEGYAMARDYSPDCHRILPKV